MNDIKIKLPGDEDITATTADDKPVLQKEESVETTKEVPETVKTDEEKGVRTEEGVKKEDTTVEKDGEPETNQVDIDGVIYTLDDKGNAIDKGGNIKYTSEDIKNLEEVKTDEVELSNLEAITKLTNIKPVDSNGEPIIYENTPEGISKYVEDVYKIASEQAVNNYEQQLFTTYPILYDVLRHVQTNGSLEGFTERTDYSKVKLEEDNEDQLKNIIITGRKSRGESDEKITKYINYLKDSDSLYDEAKEELNYLVAEDKKYEQALKDQELQAQNEKREEAKKYWGLDIKEDGSLVDIGVSDSIYGIIKSGNLKVGGKNYIIPDKIRVTDNGKVTYHSKDDFFMYLYEPVTFNVNNQKVTMTRHDYDLYVEQANRSTHDDIFDAFKRFTGYDVSQFIEENVSRTEVKRVMKKLTSRSNKQGDDVTAPSSKRIIIPKND